MHTRTGPSGAGAVVLAVMAGGAVDVTSQAPAAAAKVLTVVNEGKTVTMLGEKQGPLRIVVPRGARPTRSVRRLDRLELTRIWK